METHVEEQLGAKQTQAFTLARRAAGRVMKRRVRMYRLLRRGVAKLTKNEEAMATVVHDLRALFRLARRWVTREYRSIPWRSVLYAVAAIVYFVNPADLIPDALAGIGFIDDVAVVAAVVNAIRNELDQFRKWEQAQLLE